MIKLSVNVNKVATVRNSRGGALPSVLEAARVCAGAGAHGITVHPRADARHITAADVREIAGWLAGFPKSESRIPNPEAQIPSPGSRIPTPEIEFNIEGDPRPDLLALVLDVRPTQCTLVPVKPGEITSQAGWSPDTDRDQLAGAVRDLRAAGIRVSLFVDPDEKPIRWAAGIGADRVELFTEPFARAFERGDVAARDSFAAYARASELAASLGLGVNAGHDLDLDNLVMFRRLPHLDEVSIGHALVSRALFVGLAHSVREYLDVLAGRDPGSGIRDPELKNREP